MTNEEDKIQDVSNKETIIKREENQAPVLKRPIYIRTLNLFINPWRYRYDRYYKESKKHLVIDLILIAIILFLVGLNIYVFTRESPAVEDIQINIHRQTKGVSDVQEMPQKTELLLSAQAVYYTDEGEQVGVGVWPPQVGQTTSVRLVLKMTTNLHQINSLHLKAKLPTDVAWTGQTAVNAGEALAFDEKERAVIWSLDKLAPWQKAEVNFEVRFTPMESKTMKLLDKIVVSGIDAIMGEGVVTESQGISVEVVK